MSTPYPRPSFGDRLFGAAPRPRVPMDDVPHARTWMSWPSRKSVWGRQLRGVQEDIALIARTIALYEPVVMCAPDDYSVEEARHACGPNVFVIGSIPTDDLWMRDIAPVFRRDGRGGLQAVGLNFNGWGRKQVHTDDAHVAENLARLNGLPFVRADFVGEGGGIETDGDGTVMATESSLVNRNRNRGWSRDDIEEAVLDAYGADRMIWVPGIKGKDITDDHIDVTSRFVRPGLVLVQLPPDGRNDVWARDAREQLAILSAETDAHGQPAGGHPRRRPGHRALATLRLRRLVPQLPSRQRRRDRRPVRGRLQGRGRQADPAGGLPRP